MVMMCLFNHQQFIAILSAGLPYPWKVPSPWKRTSNPCADSARSCCGASSQRSYTRTYALLVMISLPGGNLVTWWSLTSNQPPAEQSAGKYI